MPLTQIDVCIIIARARIQGTIFRESMNKVIMWGSLMFTDRTNRISCIV